MNLTVCILAGGEGKRMKSTLPKVLHLFKGIPMIVQVINRSLELNAQKIIIITGKHNELIQKTIKQYLDDESFKKLRFVIQEIPLGTGDAVKCTLNYYENNEEVLILNGDTPNISSELLKKFINSKGENKLLISEIDDPFGYGRIIMDNSDEIHKIVEEKDCNENEKKVNKINSGIYFIKSVNLKKFIPLIKNNNSSKEFYLTDIIEIMLQNSIKSYGYLINKSENNLILGVNTIEQLNNLENI